MIGPRDEDLDVGVEDDMRHEFAFGHPLLWDGDDREQLDQDEPEQGDEE